MKLKVFSFIILIIAALVLSCKSSDKTAVKDQKIKDGPGKIFWDDGSVKGSGNFKSYQKDGIWKLYQKGTGERLAEGNYINDSQSGKWIYYYKNGKKMSEGVFEENQKTGDWLGFYDTGEKMSVAKYVIKNTPDGKIGGIEGIKTIYFKSGKVKLTEEHVNGEKNGKNQEYFENGNPKEISLFTANKHNGRCTVYYENGKIKEQGSYQDDFKIGEWKYFYDNGESQASGSFIIGKLSIKGEEQTVSQLDGRWQYFSKEGHLQKEGNYEKGKETGLWRLYSYENNARKLNMELTLKGGMAGGSGKIYDNGVLTGMGEMMGSVKGIYYKFINGKKAGEESHMETPFDIPKENVIYKWSGKWAFPKKNGQWTEYYAGSNNKKFETRYMNDKLSGKYKEYFPNGKIKAEGEYMNDKKNGLWKVYDEKGALNNEESGRWMLGKKSKVQ